MTSKQRRLDGRLVEYQRQQAELREASRRRGRGEPLNARDWLLAEGLERVPLPDLREWMRGEVGRHARLWARQMVAGYLCAACGYGNGFFDDGGACPFVAGLASALGYPGGCICDGTFYDADDAAASMDDLCPAHGDRAPEARSAEQDSGLLDRAWPYTTPEGHTYAIPQTYEALCERHTDAAQAEIEGWAEAERPPEPTWEMLGVAHERVQALLADRELWRDRAFRAARLAMEPEGPEALDTEHVAACQVSGVWHSDQTAGVDIRCSRCQTWLDVRYHSADPDWLTLDEVRAAVSAHVAGPAPESPGGEPK